MKVARLAIAGAVVAALTGPAGVANAGDSVTGAATILSMFRGIEVDAHSDASGANPTGTAGAGARSTYSVNGRVTCLTVVGNRATIGIDVDENVGFGGGPGHYIFVEDNGTPGAGHDLANDAPTSQVPTSCPAPTDEDLVPFPFIPTRPQPIEAGDIVVHDALTRPQAKAACKAEREAIGRPAFRAKYGTPHALRNCIQLKRA